MFVQWHTLTGRQNWHNVLQYQLDDKESVELLEDNNCTQARSLIGTDFLQLMLYYYLTIWCRINGVGSRYIYMEGNYISPLIEYHPHCECRVIDLNRILYQPKYIFTYFRTILSSRIVSAKYYSYV